LTCWSVDLESSRYIKRHVIKVCTKFERNRAIPGWIIDNFWNFFARYVMLWRWPFTSWPWTFILLRVSCVQTMYKIWGKSNYLRLSYRRFSTFSHAILGVCRTDKASSGVLRFNFTKLGRGSNDVKFSIFDPLWKLGEGWARSICELLKPYLRPNLRNTFDGHPQRGCWARWIDKK